ncbi:MAG: histidinol-phosphatase [Clostridia bacterium]|nr:histidinol-phosphatase [Clostridia bacterium]
MARKDCHLHTTFSDGLSTPEEMVLSAIRLGLETIAFTDHSHTPFDESYCMLKENVAPYRTEILRLQEKYKGKIEILLGIEQDYFGDPMDWPYDFVVGSVHYIKAGDEYIPVDEDAETLASAADRHFGGDIYALVEAYYDLVGDVVEKTGADLIGHFDLITKFQEKTPLFDEAHPRYIKAFQHAADRLLVTGVPFEINFGAIPRGYRTTPYPSPEIRRYLTEHGATLVLSSDSHSADTICYQFELFE